ncbi:hypothetical protein V1477_006972 [Vespula maculifrons]|uniref:Uncharacterized protein n=1 Tax=Vespula maculifrons TaxID=7453 RepID=A0ABD2CHZ8_VESMC
MGERWGDGEGEEGGKGFRRECIGNVLSIRSIQNPEALGASKRKQIFRPSQALFGVTGAVVANDDSTPSAYQPSQPS